MARKLFATSYYSTHSEKPVHPFTGGLVLWPDVTWKLTAKGPISANHLQLPRGFPGPFVGSQKVGRALLANKLGHPIFASLGDVQVSMGVPIQAVRDV